MGLNDVLHAWKRKRIPREELELPPARPELEEPPEWTEATWSSHVGWEIDSCMDDILLELGATPDLSSLEAVKLRIRELVDSLVDGEFDADAEE